MSHVSPSTFLSPRETRGQDMASLAGEWKSQRHLPTSTFPVNK